MGLREQLSSIILEPRINLYYEKAVLQKLNYYDMLELSKTATSREIDTAFRAYSALFPLEQLSNIRNDEVRRKADILINKLRKAYATLSDYGKRAEYEKRGFREEDEVDVRDDPTEKAKLLYRKAKTLQQQKDYRTAIMAMKEAINLDPKTPSYYFLLGLCQSEIPTMTQDAEKNLQKASEMEEWNAEPLVALGMLYYKVNLLKRAETFFRRALDLDQAHPVARKKLEEIVGPEKKSFLASLRQLFAPLRSLLAKLLPTFFDEKKK